ncbi:hypothetical protein [Streptomyces sp. NPDC056672]|uniref:hypothetical protein n=1 Tax=Streptomyces sp. NPDC056672 TaxID=3345906 RepID=UPI0036C21EDB
MTLALAAVPNPAHDVARWVLNRLGPELWEVDRLLDTAILRNRHGHEILIQADGDELTLAAEVNLADNDDVPLTTIREVQPLPTGPGDPVVTELIDAIRYRLAPAYGRQNVIQAVAVLTAPLLATSAVLDWIDEEDGRATIDIGRRRTTRHTVTVAQGQGAAPSVGLAFQALSLWQAQEVVRAALLAHGHAIPAPRDVAPCVLRTMFDVARGDASPEAVTDSVVDPGYPTVGSGPAVYSIVGLVAEVGDGLDVRVRLWIGPVGVETATAVLYAYANAS